MAKIALLDGDSWVYRCGFASEKTYYLVTKVDTVATSGQMINGLYDSYRAAKDAQLNISGQSIIWSRKEIEPLENCLQTVKSSLENTLNVLGISEYKLYISGRGNFRDDIYEDYKANRDTLGKPKYYRDIRRYLREIWNAETVNGMEADDAIGISAMAIPESVIVAVDKDLDQIPGDHYNWVKGENYTVSPKEGLRFFYEQLLSGDATDNIPGIDGIGPVKAKKALAECTTPKECAQLVHAMYEGAGSRLDVDTVANLIWIKRKTDDTHPFWRHLK